MADVEQNGVDAARRDIAEGVLRYKWIGHGGRGGKDFCRLVAERLRMTVDDFGICFVTQDKITFAQDYNRAVRDHLVSVHGRDLVDEAMTEARTLHKEQYDRYTASLESDGGSQ